VFDCALAFGLMRNWPLLAILGLATVLRLTWVVFVPNAQYSDSVWYEAAAANLAAHGVYGPDGPSAWFPPGYPFLLTALYRLAGHSELVGKLANVAIGIALTAFTFLLARQVASEVVARLSALVVAIWPNLIFHTGILSSDLLSALGFVAAMWLGMRRGFSGWQAWLLGALIGWMVLVRPVSLILLPALALWWWLDRHSGRSLVTRLTPVVVVVSMIIGGWTVRNYVEFREIIPIATNGGYNFWQTNHRYADGNDTFWPFVPMDDPEYQTMWYGDEFTKSREGYRYALAYLSAHPDHLLKMFPTKLFWLYHTDTSGFYEGALYPPMETASPFADWIADHERLVESLTFRYYEAIMALSVVGATMAVFRGKANARVWALLSLPVLLTVFHLFFHAKDRFHIPVDGLIALFAAIAMVEIAQSALALLASRRSQTAIASG
jgi:hypothetical protein